MKMPVSHSAENGYYDYETSYYSVENIENYNNGTVNGGSAEDDFSEYLWMENMEEFDKEVMQRLEEEALMEQCIEAMLADIDEPENAVHSNNLTTNNTETANEVSNLVSNLKLDSEEIAKSSNLNPLAAEFVPSSRPNTQQKSEEK